MDVYIHYNLNGGTPDAHTKIKDTMKNELGYMDLFTIKSDKYYLPNASLWHKKKTSLKEPYADLVNVVAEINKLRKENDKVIIERCIVLPFGDEWFAIPGQPHAS
jgi:hypothetical protein